MRTQSVSSDIHPMVITKPPIVSLVSLRHTHDRILYLDRIDLGHCLMFAYLSHGSNVIRPDSRLLLQNLRQSRRQAEPPTVSLRTACPVIACPVLACPLLAYPVLACLDPHYHIFSVLMLQWAYTRSRTPAVTEHVITSQAPKRQKTNKNPPKHATAAHPTSQTPHHQPNPLSASPFKV